MEYSAYDYDTGEFYSVSGKLVACIQDNCINKDVLVEVADDPNGCVFCSPCGTWIIPPRSPDPENYSNDSF